MTKSTTKINEDIAREKGWRQRGQGWWYHLDDPRSWIHPPKFTERWEFAGSLLEELIDAQGINLKMWKEVCGLKRHKVQTRNSSKSISSVFGGDALPEAIARAYHAWKFPDKL